MMKLLDHLPTRQEWLLSAKTFAAAMLAFYIALSIGLPRPYWAMATVYVVSNPLTGATRSKGVYRLLGTLIGASMAVFILPLLINTPILLSLFISVWTGTLLYLSFLDRLPSNYVYMLSAYTLPMIALPAVQVPDQVFQIAVARSEEIGLAIVCASLVSALVLPGRVAPVLDGRFRAWLADAGQWAIGILKSESEQPGASAQTMSVNGQKLSADVLALDHFISHLAYDSDSADLVQMARELRMKLSLLLPTLSSLTSAVAALRASPRGVPARLRQLMDEIAAWMQDGMHGETQNATAEGLRLQRRLQRLARTRGVAASWDDLLLRHVLTRMQGLVQLWRDGQALRAMMTAGRLDPSWTPAYQRWTFSTSVRHHDYGMKLFSAVSVCLLIFLSCVGWIYSGWGDGAGAVIMCAVVSCFFAAQDEPAASQRGFFWATAISTVIGTVLLFLILPAAHEFETLVLALAPVFLIVGTLMSRPAFAGMALGVSVTLATSLGLSDAYSADFGLFVNGSLASVFGCLLAVIWTLLTRPFGAELSLRRLLRATWTDLAQTAAGQHRGDEERLRARMIDRLHQLLPRLSSRERHGTDGLDDLRVGLCTVLLQREEAQLPSQAAREVQRVLAKLQIFYRRRLSRSQTAAVARPRLNAGIDRAIAALMAVGPRTSEAAEVAEATHEALHALAELRLTLCPSPALSAPIVSLQGGSA